ncbi:MAG: hypothetical protein MI923_05460 [Phycisphaerales bacterium]|nr:hypothetical protein [Phycisphaerales bacterium]
MPLPPKGQTTPLFVPGGFAPPISLSAAKFALFRSGSTKLNAETDGSISYLSIGRQGDY